MSKTSNPLPDSELEEGGNEINTVYGDMVTFIMMLFILLFVLSYNNEKDDKSYDKNFFTQLQQQFAGKTTQPKPSISTDSLLVSQLRNFIEKEKLDKQAQILVDEQKVKLILSTPLLFDSGKAAIKIDGFKILKNIADILKNIENPLMIEGHTDSVPIHTQHFDSNWDLSFHRAYAVLKYFIHKLNFSPKQLSGIGYGEYRPVADNKTLQGRSKNRRIEINVIRVVPVKS